MTMTRRMVMGASVVFLLTLTAVRAQEPPARGGGAGGQGRGGGRGAPRAGQTPPAVQQISSRPPVDADAEARGKAL